MKSLLCINMILDIVHCATKNQKRVKYKPSMWEDKMRSLLQALLWKEDINLLFDYLFRILHPVCYFFFPDFSSFIQLFFLSCTIAFLVHSFTTSLGVCLRSLELVRLCCLDCDHKQTRKDHQNKVLRSTRQQGERRRLCRSPKESKPHRNFHLRHVRREVNPVH